MLGTILLILLVLMLLGALPAWPHSKSWGYAPSGTLGTVLLIVLVLVLRRTALRSLRTGTPTHGRLTASRGRRSAP